jgi:uncharacterized membrane protein YeiB
VLFSGKFNSMFSMLFAIGFILQLVGSAVQLVLAIAIYFVIQVPLSRWWLNRFALGPMEYVWRWLTYGPAALKVRAAPREVASQH